MAKKKNKKKKSVKKLEPTPKWEPPTTDTDTNVGDSPKEFDEVLKDVADEHDETFRKLADGPEPIDLNNAKCDTCGRTGKVMECPKCGKTYCNQCRTPHHGHYKVCMGGCHQSLPT